jgi:hypothetical protein
MQFWSITTPVLHVAQTALATGHNPEQVPPHGKCWDSALKLGHSFLSKPFQFIIYHSIIQSYTALATEKAL